MTFDKVERYRETTGLFETKLGDDFGKFWVPSPFRENKALQIIASSGIEEISNGWEHVSVSLPSCCPTWDEMCFVKDLFWNENETVIQFHPAKSEYVNNHKFCLHLWRPTRNEILTPPSLLVGLK